MQTGLDERGVEGGNLAVGQLKEILGNGFNEIQNRLNKLEAGNVVGGQTNEQQEQVQCKQVVNMTYTIHFFTSLVDVMLSG